MNEYQKLRIELANLAAKGRRLAAEGETRRIKAELTRISFEALRLSLEGEQKKAVKQAAKRGSVTGRAEHNTR